MSIDLYPDIVLEGDLSPDFPPEVDELCDEIYKACKGFGTDEDRLIRAMSRDIDTRTLVSLRYEPYKGKDLRKLMKKECGGDFGRALQLLAEPPDVAEARIIDNATDGIGTNERLLFTVVCGRSNRDMMCLRKAYFKTYNKDLGAEVKSEVSGDLEDFLFTCLQGGEEEYDPEFHTEEKAKEDAEAFYKAGEGRWGTDEKSIFKKLCFSPPQHLDNVNKAYTNKYDVTLFKAFEKELGGDVEKAVLFTLGMKLKPYETVATLIKTSCAGIGTDEELLAACIIRYQKILPQVMVAHMELFGKSVQERVRDEVKRDFCKLLLEVLNNAHPEG